MTAERYVRLSSSAGAERNNILAALYLPLKQVPCAVLRDGAWGLFAFLAYEIMRIQAGAALPDPLPQAGLTFRALV